MSELVRLRPENAEQLDYLCKSCGKTKAQFLAEIIDSCFGIVASLKPHVKYIGMQSDSSILKQQVTITFIGKNAILMGHFQAPTTDSDKEVDKTVKAKVEEVFDKELEDD